MYFAPVQSKLLQLVRERVRSGELTERGLARMTSISQPHLHNILKGIRALSPEIADEILRHLGLTLADLCEANEVRTAPNMLHPAVEPIPVFSGRCGPLAGPPEQEGTYLFPRSQVARLTDPVALILCHDDSMYPRFQEGDLVLLDRSNADLSLLAAQACYVVDHSKGNLVRYLRRTGPALYLATEESLDEPVQWEQVSLAERTLTEIVIGRVVWMGRQVEPWPARPVRKAG